MPSTHGDIFESLRANVLDTFVDSRNSIDDAFGGLDEAEIRQYFTRVLTHMRRYIESPSPVQLHDSASSWVAYLLSLGLAPRSVLRSVVSLGDFIVKQAREQLQPGPFTNVFIRDVVRMNFNAARAVVVILNDEFNQREAELRGEPVEAN